MLSIKFFLNIWACRRVRGSNFKESSLAVGLSVSASSQKQNACALRWLPVVASSLPRHFLFLHRWASTTIPHVDGKKRQLSLFSSTREGLQRKSFLPFRSHLFLRITEGQKDWSVKPDPCGSKCFTHVFNYILIRRGHAQITYATNSHKTLNFLSKAVFIKTY